MQGSAIAVSLNARLEGNKEERGAEPAWCDAILLSVPSALNIRGHVTISETHRTKEFAF